VQNVPAGRKNCLGNVSCVREADILLFYSPGLPDQGDLCKINEAQNHPETIGSGWFCSSYVIGGCAIAPASLGGEGLTM